jgi:hypothetical protein
MKRSRDWNFAVEVKQRFLHWSHKTQSEWVFCLGLCLAGR